MQALRLVKTSDLTLEQWLEWRRKGITGSRIAAIMEKNPWESPLGVYLEMTGQVAPKEQNESMYFGTVLEDFIAREFSLRSGKKVQKVNFILQHPHYEFLLANIDRMIVGAEEGNGILECKNVSEYAKDQWMNGAPEQYVMQLQWYLGITGFNYGYLCALCGGNKFMFHRYERDEALIELMFEKATDFWFLHIEPQVPPPVTYNDADALSTLYPASDGGKVVNLADEESHLITGLLEAKKAKQEAEKIELLAVNRMKERMGQAEILFYNGEKVCTWKSNKNGARVFKILMKDGECGV